MTRLIVINLKGEKVDGWKCENCGAVFQYAAPVEEADKDSLEEYQAMFAGESEADPIQVCDVCYLMALKATPDMRKRGEAAQ